MTKTTEDLKKRKRKEKLSRKIKKVNERKGVQNY